MRTHKHAALQHTWRGVEWGIT